MFMYTVKSGDSLYSIARKYNTTVADIMNLNYLKSYNLSIGQVLRIPETYTKEGSEDSYGNLTVIQTGLRNFDPDNSQNCGRILHESIRP